MHKLITTIAAAAVLLPAAALAQNAPTEVMEHRFTRAGTTYIYTVAPAAGGRQVIEGRRLPGNSAFRLVVNGDRVDGMSGGQPVSFRAPRSSGVTLAAR